MATTWGPKHISVVLSNGDRTASYGSGSSPARRLVRSVGGVSGGKAYFEVVVNDTDDYFQYLTVGICLPSLDATSNDDQENIVGTDSVADNTDESWGVRCEFNQKRYLSVNTGISIGACDDGDTLMFAIDRDAGKVWFGRNGTFDGNPAGGSGEAYSSIGAGTIHAVATIGYDADSTESVTANFASVNWTYTPPTGFATELAEGSKAGDGDVGVALQIEGDGWAEKIPTAVLNFPILVSGTGLVEKFPDADLGFVLDINATALAEKIPIGNLGFAFDIEGTGNVDQTEGSGVGIALGIEATGETAHFLQSGDLDLPLLYSTGEGATGVVGTGAVTIPLIEALGYSAGQAELTLPVVEIDAQSLMGALGTSALTLPALRVTSSGSAVNLAQGSVVLPAVSGNSSGVAGSISTAALVLRALVSAGQGHPTSIGTAAVTLPLLRSTGVSQIGSIGTGAVVLPILRIFALDVPAYSTEILALSTEVLAHTRYSGMPFIYVAELNGQVYGIDSTGLYLLEGDDDAGTDISAQFKTGVDDLGSDFLKMASNFYVGYETDGVLEATIGVDGGTSYTYEVSRDLLTSGQRGARAPIAKGLRSRYWQLGLQNKDGADFKVDAFGFTVTPSRRKS